MIRISKIYLFLFASVIFLNSCQLVLKTYYGIREPEVENEKSIVQYLKRKHIEANNIYTVNKADYIEIIEQIKGVPEILIFDKNGRNIIYKEKGQCNSYAFDFIEQLSTGMTLKYNDSLKLDDCLLKLKDFEGKSVIISKNKDIDYYIFIFWVRYSGRLNKNHVKIWEEQAKKNARANIKVLKVNLDQQKWWNDTLKIK